MLGLHPTTSANGLRYYEHPAGFANGTYPIEPFAELVGASVDQLQTTLADKEATRFGHVILKFSNYIVPVRSHYADASAVSADMVTELSQEGEALINTALTIADYSSKKPV